MALDFRDAFTSHAIPHHFSSALVEGVHMPTVRRCVFVRINIAVQPVTKVVAALAADGCSDEDPVSPNNRARVRESGNRSLPKDVCAFGCIPGRRCWLAIRNSGSIRPKI